MTTIITDKTFTDSVKHPETVLEVQTHPQTGHRGHFIVRTGKPVQRYNRQTRKNEWVQQHEIERIDKPSDGAIFMLVNDGYMSANDFEEMRLEAEERRQGHRRNRPLIAPKPSLIEEACKQVFLTNAETYEVNGITFHRPSKGMLIPRNAAWAEAMAEESKTGWETKLWKR